MTDVTGWPSICAVGLLAGCALAPLDETGKLCSQTQPCGPGYSCTADGTCGSGAARATPDSTPSSASDGGDPFNGFDGGQDAGAADAGQTGGGCFDLMEDDFRRPDQMGWGVMSNDAGLTRAAWGAAADGGQPSVHISGNTGVIGYPGTVGVPEVGVAGAAVFGGGEALVQISVSATWGVNAGAVLNACPDGACFYSARLNTSAGIFELVKRASGQNTRELFLPFSAAAGARYWIRARLDPGTSALSGKIWLAGAAEPSSWQLQWVDLGPPLGAAYPGVVAGWGASGASQSASFLCFAFAPPGGPGACGCNGAGP